MAITVALLATFLGVCKVKDDNIVQAMQQAQADRLDHWNFYQARNVRQEVAAAAAVQLKLASAGAPPGSRRPTERPSRRTKRWRRAGEEERRASAAGRPGSEDYDALNYRDDQFDLSDALIALAISLLALTALTHKNWLYWLALVATVGGVVMGLAGLLGWHLHPDALARLLS